MRTLKFLLVTLLIISAVPVQARRKASKKTAKGTGTVTGKGR